MYRVELSHEAQRFYDRCDKTISKKLVRCFQSQCIGAPAHDIVGVRTAHGSEVAVAAIAAVTQTDLARLDSADTIAALRASADSCDRLLDVA